MKTKIKKSMVLSMVLACLFSGTVFARDIQKYNEARNTYVHSELLPQTTKEAYDIIRETARSTAMGAAICSIKDAGQGVIKIWAETAMYKPVQWAGLTLYLERWDEENKTWRIVAEFEKEFLPEDEEDGQLTTATIEEFVSGQPMGYYYRARALHELEFDGDWYEIRVTKTDGILMEYVP